MLIRFITTLLVCENEYNGDELHRGKSMLVADELNNLQLCSTIFLLPWVTQCSTNDKLCILVKAQPCTRSHLATVTN